MFGGRISGPELIIILAVLLLLFGARRLPSLARSIGQAAKEFRKGVQDGGTGAGAEDSPPGETDS